MDLISLIAESLFGIVVFYPSSIELVLVLNVLLNIGVLVFPFVLFYLVNLILNDVDVLLIADVYAEHFVALFAAIAFLIDPLAVDRLDKFVLDFGKYLHSLMLAFFLV